MKRIVVWIKENPLYAAAIGIGVIVLLWLIFRRRGQATESGGLVIQGPSDAAIQAGIQAQQMAAATSSQAQQAQNQLTALREQIAGTIAIETIKAQTSLAGQESQIAGQIAIEGQRLAVEQTLGLAQLETTLAAERLREESAIAQQQIAGVTAIQQSSIMANTLIAQQQLYVSGQTQLATIQAQAQAKAGQQSFWSQLAGGALTLGAVLLSDRRVKTDIQPVYRISPFGVLSDERVKHEIEILPPHDRRERNGLRLWSYRRNGFPGREIGFIAQDLERSGHGDLVSMVPGTDVRVVDYASAMHRASVGTQTYGT
jgi:hypothetical protein